ncbi:hypothetical protein PM082_006142 [Marasmius tenuissimus]|nr:hypothetical protein PM082_006142 [Marasmius tenuissimus]
MNVSTQSPLSSGSSFSCHRLMYTHLTHLSPANRDISTKFPLTPLTWSFRLGTHIISNSTDAREWETKAGNAILAWKAGYSPTCKKRGADRDWYPQTAEQPVIVVIQQYVSIPRHVLNPTFKLLNMQHNPIPR